VRAAGEGVEHRNSGGGFTFSSGFQEIVQKRGGEKEGEEIMSSIRARGGEGGVWFSRGGKPQAQLLETIEGGKRGGKRFVRRPRGKEDHLSFPRGDVFQSDDGMTLDDVGTGKRKV